MLLKDLPLSLTEPSISVHPPDPDVGIEKNQRKISQSASATDSVGSS